MQLTVHMYIYLWQAARISLQKVCYEYVCINIIHGHVSTVSMSNYKASAMQDYGKGGSHFKSIYRTDLNKKGIDPS